MINQFFIDKRPHNGLTYSAYVESLKEYVESFDTLDLSDEKKKDFELTKINLQRSTRIYKTYIVNDLLRSKIASISEPQIWMILSEIWCGDSAQNLPYLAKIAECNPLIDLRIILRDENLDIMDMYLNEYGNKSIPKLIAFDKDGNELFQWGPRPNEAAELISKLKSEGKTKDQFLVDLHLWYAKNKGKNLENEILDLI